MPLNIAPIAGAPLGAVVRGWRPTEPLDERLLGQIKPALVQHLVLVFRGHRTPADEELVAFAGSFGALTKGSEWFRDSGDHPEILPVTNALDDAGIPLGTGGAGPLEWHADCSYLSQPGKESFLDALELPHPTPPREPISAINTPRWPVCPPRRPPAGSACGAQCVRVRACRRDA